MKRLWKVLPVIAACLLATASAHNINVQVWLNPAPLTARDSAAFAALEQLGAQHQFTVDSSSNPVSLEASSLQNAQVLLFLNRNGAGLNATQRDDIENFIGAGGGFLAIHDGLLPEANWIRFDSIIGATVGNMLPSQQMTVLNPDKTHAATRELPFRYDWTSPWYDFVEGPRGNAHILLSVRKLPGSSFRGEHPVSWAKLFGRGRVFATTLGASAADFSDGYFQEHLLGAIEWCGGAMDGDVRVTDDAAFDLAILADNIEACMAIDIADDGRIFYVEKKGRIFRWDPVSQSSKKLLDWSNTGTQHNVYFPFENGLFGMALDPDFPQKPYIYIHYSFTGSDPWGPGTGQHRVSRLELIGDSIDESSEEVFLEYDFDRDAQIHSGGCLAFDNGGNLLIATGDNTSYGVGATKNPYNPADPRPGNAIYDAQRTSANTADFRGKILRIRPSAHIGGGYSLPAGNLFADSDSTFGEIYLMGVRNPFKFCVDPATGWLAWGDVGPDAVADDSLRGPMGKDEYNLAKRAGNYGWPYMLGDNRPYREYDYDAMTSGNWFDPNNLQNNSPNSDGIIDLPPAQPAMLWEDKNLFTPEWPEFGKGNITAMAGAFYRYDSTIADPNKLPEYYDRTLFVMDWTRDWIKAVCLDSAGNVVKISPFLDSVTVIGPMDMKIGPDGAIYLMEWRTDKWGGLTSRIVRLRYAPDGRSPIAIIDADRNNGLATLVVNFDGNKSFDPDNQPLSYRWDFGDGSPVATGPQVSHNYRNPGVYSAKLEVENSNGKTGSAQLTITAGNNRPEVDIAFPVNGGVFGWGETIDFKYSISDDQDGNTGDGSIDCSDAEARVLVGHDAHAHPSVPFTTCEGSFAPSSEGHVTTDDELFLLFEASYTDVAPFQSGSLRGSAIHLLQPKLKQAEHHDAASGISIIPTLDSLSVSDVSIEEDSAWIAIEPLNFYRINSFKLRYTGSGGKVQLWKGGLDGNGLLLKEENLPASPSDSAFVSSSSINFSDPGGTDIYYFRFVKNGQNGIERLNWIEFEGLGVSVSNDEPIVPESIADAPVRWEIYPNPASEKLWVDLRGERGDVELQLLDLHGKVFASKTAQLETASLWRGSFGLHGLAEGVYFVRIKKDDFVGYGKVFVR